MLTYVLIEYSYLDSGLFLHKIIVLNHNTYYAQNLSCCSFDCIPGAGP